MEITEEQLMAYADGALDAQQRSIVEQALADRDIDVQGNGLENPRPCAAQDEVEGNDDQNPDHQPGQGAEAGMEDHPVIHLQHEHRHGDGQQVDEQRQDQHLLEQRNQRFQEGRKPGSD